MSYINNNNVYGSSSYGVNGLSNSLSNMGLQQTGVSYSSVPVPPPLPQQSLLSSSSNNFLAGRNLYTREWNQASTQYSSLPSTTSYTTTTSVLPAATTSYATVAAPVAAPVAAVANGMLPPPINDGRRYARLTGQKAGSRRSRRHLVQPLNGTGLQTLPAGIPVEGLAAMGSASGRKSRRAARGTQGLNNARNMNSAANLPVTSNYISLGSTPAGSALPLATSSALPVQQQFVQQQQILPQQQFVQQQQFVPQQQIVQQQQFVPQQQFVQQQQVVAPVASGMLPPPINDGRRYARLTGQKAGSRRSRRHLVQPLNGTGLQTLPAGIPVEGLAAASARSGRRTRRTASRGLNNGNRMTSVPLGLAPTGFSAPLASSVVGTSALPQPHLAQIPLSAPAPVYATTTVPVSLLSQPMIKQQVLAPTVQPMIGGATF